MKLNSTQIFACIIGAMCLLSPVLSPVLSSYANDKTSSTQEIVLSPAYQQMMEEEYKLFKTPPKNYLLNKEEDVQNVKSLKDVPNFVLLSGDTTVLMLTSGTTIQVRDPAIFHDVRNGEYRLYFSIVLKEE